MMISIFSTKTAIAAFMCGAALITAHASAATSLQLYSVTSQPFTSIPTGVKPCYLDVANAVLHNMNKELSINSSVAQSRFIAQHKEAFNLIAQSRLCQFQAAQLGVTKLPAIVFNSDTVIYGVRNVNATINRYQQSVRGQS